MSSQLRLKVREWAIISRLFALTAQVLFNAVIPDHESDAFSSPVEEDEFNFLDWVVLFLFGGLGHWDGQHFMHIAKFGYTYENNLAFFPLYPALIKVTANTMGLPLQQILSYHNVILISGLCINFVCFVLSAEMLYELSRIVLREERTAYKAALLYCINPASVFFSATYSEALFSLCVFTGMLLYEKNYSYLSAACFAVGGAARSNGILNCGFPLYSALRQVVACIESSNGENVNVRIVSLFFIRLLGSVFKMLVCVCIIIVPLIVHQLYAYRNFCEEREIDLPVVVKMYAQEENLQVADSDVKPSWCYNAIPSSYGEIQEKYWNVGFLKYYEWKQITNFLLALPMAVLIFTGVFRYCFANSEVCLKFGFGFKNEEHYNLRNLGINSPLMFVYLVHGLAMLTFGLLFINVQVITRMLCAASPIVYWFAAAMTSSAARSIPYDYEHSEEKPNDIETSENFRKVGCNILVDQILQWKFNRTSCLVILYFLSYSTLGMLLFVNSLPFT